MKLVVEIEDGMVAGVYSDQPIHDIDVIIMTNNLEHAGPEVIGRADGKDVLVYSTASNHIDDRRFWRDITESVKKTDADFAKTFLDREGAIEGEAHEVISKDRMLQCR